MDFSNKDNEKKKNDDDKEKINNSDFFNNDKKFFEKISKNSRVTLIIDDDQRTNQNQSINENNFKDKNKENINISNEKIIDPLKMLLEQFLKDGFKSKNNPMSTLPIIDYNLEQDFIENSVELDFASSIGDIKYLDNWLNKNLNSNNKFCGNHNDYTSASIDLASSNGKINILNWWLNAKINNYLELKYTNKSIDNASKNGQIEVLDWWLNAKKNKNLELKYSSESIDNASISYKINILEWWFKNKQNIDFIHTNKSMDNVRLEENKLLKLVKWWKEKIDLDKSIKNIDLDKSTKNLDKIIEFKYSDEFINYLKMWDYNKTLNYLKENEMLKNNENIETDNTSKKNSNFVNLIDLMGLPFVSLKNKESNSKYDTSNLPTDIQKHIKEKEEELNNNMLTNGKVKEYIDNLIKIPFGKYRLEKIFLFISDFINKLNEINIKNVNINTKKLENESDLYNFFEKIKFINNSIYDKYYNLFKEYCEFRIQYINYVDDILNNTVYGHYSTKKQIKCIITQWLSGGLDKGIVIGIYGPPGVGKTTIIKNALSKCLVNFIDYDLNSEEPYIKLDEIQKDSRPFCFISLGGTTNGSTLSGHNITYHGATSGDIVKHLKEAGIMNPILFFDELDKISNTEHGHEISSVLTHITDPVQNEHFTDRYFSEVKIDLSKCIIVFSYNDSSKIDKILLDRIHEIKLRPIKPNEKIIICKKFILPEVCKSIGYNNNDIYITEDKLEQIIKDYTFEAGVRKLKEKIYEIVRIHHMENIINNNKNNKFIKQKFIDDVFSDYPKINSKKICSNNKIGCINGLFASSIGIGGITIIQVKEIYAKEPLSITITGSIEKIMEESVKVARTVAWNLLTLENQRVLINKYNSRGIHVHFPEGSTPKDGPSGGTAITCAIYSLFIEKPIKNDIAITGEIDLDGNVTMIGGLDEKLNGAKRAGVKKVLIPFENLRELNIVKKNNPDLLGKNFSVFTISHVDEALQYIF